MPVIGHLHHLAGVAPCATSRGATALRLRNVPVVVASSPDAAREVTMTHDVALASRSVAPALRLLHRGAKGVTFAPYGDGWRQMRRVCTLELFAAPRVRSFRAVREDELGRLLRAVAVAGAGAAPVNLTRWISRFLFDSAVRAIAGGSRSEHRDEFLRMLQEALRTLPKFSLLDFFPPSRLATLASYVSSHVIVRRRAAMRSIVPDLDAILDSIIREHQERRDDAAATGVQDDGDEDLLDVLLRLQKDMDSQYPLTTHIKSVIMDLFVAGGETSATALQWAMIELMRNPAVMQKAQDEVRTALDGQSKVTEDGLTNLHCLRLVIKETLRLYPQGAMVLGFHVPQGAMVLVNAWAIGRDPAHWDAPEDFVPERFEHGGRDFKGADFEYIPFGPGRRMCPGMAFGLAHVELGLAALLFHFD